MLLPKQLPHGLLHNQLFAKKSSITMRTPRLCLRAPCDRDTKYQKQGGRREIIRRRTLPMPRQKSEELEAPIDDFREGKAAAEL